MNPTLITPDVEQLQTPCQPAASLPGCRMGCERGNKWAMRAAGSAVVGSGLDRLLGGRDWRASGIQPLAICWLIVHFQHICAVVGDLLANWCPSRPQFKRGGGGRPEAGGWMGTMGFDGQKIFALAGVG